MAITLQSGLREYTGDLSQYTGMLGGLTPDIHTLRSLNPETTNRVICVMYRGPWFMMQYLDAANMYNTAGLFMTYKKVLEYYNTAIQVNMNSRDLNTTQLKGGFAGRTINFATQQNAQQNQTLTITVPELVGRPITTFHNMWVDGMADGITGLTSYHGLVAGSYDNDTHQYKQVFVDESMNGKIALEPSPAWEVAEFLIIALDRSGARVEGAVAALGCFPQGKVGQELYNFSNNGNSQILPLTLTYNCQFVESAYINDLATRYVKQFAVFGNSNNFNPGAGDAFFSTPTSTEIDTKMFNGGKAPTHDAVQSSVGNMPVFMASPKAIERKAKLNTAISVEDHSRIYTGPDTTTDISNPYADASSGNRQPVGGTTGV